MIHPNMATMLATIVTDAAVEPAALARLLRAAVETSFNCISVDGDTSTNDTVLVLANGAAGPVDAGDLQPRRSPTSAPTSRSRSCATARARRSSSRSGSRARPPMPRRGRPRAVGRQLAAGQDRVLWRRRELGPHPGRGRLFRRDGRSGQRGSVDRGGDRAGYCGSAATGRRGPAARLLRRGCERDLRREGDHRARGAGAGPGSGDRLDVRPEPRIRDINGHYRT